MPDSHSMNQLSKAIRHLQNIKGWIRLEEMEEIDDDIEELQKQPYNEDVQNIITLLQFGLYTAAVDAIDEFLRNSMLLVHRHDLRCFGLIWHK